MLGSLEYLLPNGGQCTISVVAKWWPNVGQFRIPVAKWWTVYNIYYQMVESLENLLTNGGQCIIPVAKWWALSIRITFISGAKGKNTLDFCFSKKRTVMHQEEMFTKSLKMFSSRKSAYLLDWQYNF
jgi:hypothetical protein